MEVSSYKTNHKGQVDCPDLEKYIDYMRSWRKRPDGVYSTWDDFNNASMILNRMPGVEKFCGCGAFNSWRSTIKKTFEQQPRWEDFA